jgi:hypothetical protein
MADEDLEKELKVMSLRGSTHDPEYTKALEARNQLSRDYESNPEEHNRQLNRLDPVFRDNSANRVARHNVRIEEEKKKRGR